jgi:hypothetical protein
VRQPAALLVLVALSGCPRTPPDCEYDSVERCLWERGQTKPDGKDPKDSGTSGLDPDLLEGDDEPFERWVELDQAVDGLAGLVGAGLEWPLFDAKARELCEYPPEVRVDAEGVLLRAWSCPLGQPLALDDKPLVLELGEGVASLTADALSERASGKLVALALDSTADACLDEFESVEGPVNQEFLRCTLRTGPMLYIGRFPRDLDADRWQVSIAVVDAG